MWFGKEIFPKILEKCPDLVWYVVGGKVTEEIKALENEHIRILGYVTDERSQESYKTCRLVVVP